MSLTPDPGDSKQLAQVERGLTHASRQAVRRQAAAEAVQHPSALLPFSAAGISLAYVLFFAGAVGGESVALVLMGFSTAAGVLGFIRRYPLEIDSKQTEVRQLLAREEDQREAIELQELATRLKVQFQSFDHAEGLRALRNLSLEYREVEPEAVRRPNDPSTMLWIPHLVRDTYREGLDALNDAAMFLKVAHTPTAEELQAEIAVLESQIAAMRGHSEQAGGIANRERRRADLLGRLSRLQDINNGIETALGSADVCETALHHCRMDLALARAGQSSVDSVADTLRRTIRQVREIQEEVRRLGFHGTDTISGLLR